MLPRICADADHGSSHVDALHALAIDCCAFFTWTTTPKMRFLRNARTRHPRRGYRHNPLARAEREPRWPPLFSRQHIRFLEGENPSNSVLAVCLVPGNLSLSFPLPTPPITHHPSSPIAQRFGAALCFATSAESNQRPAWSSVAWNALTVPLPTSEHPLPLIAHPLRLISRSVDAK